MYVNVRAWCRAKTGTLINGLFRFLYNDLMVVNNKYIQVNMLHVMSLKWKMGFVFATEISWWHSLSTCVMRDGVAKWVVCLTLNRSFMSSSHIKGYSRCPKKETLPSVFSTGWF